MEYIVKVNKAVARLRRQMPHHEVFAVIDQYKKKYGTGDYYLTLNSLGHKVGIEAKVEQVFSEWGECIGSVATVHFQLGNPSYSREVVKELKKFPDDTKGYNNCIVHAVREQLYALMGVPCLEEYVFESKEASVH